MSLEFLNNNSYLKAKHAEKKVSFTGSSETAIREYMNGAICIESGTESECDFHSHKSNRSCIRIQSTEDNIPNPENLKTKKSFSKIISDSIQKQLLQNEKEDKEQRNKECQRQYNLWLERKKKEKAEKNRIEHEKIKEKEKQVEAEKKFRSLQNDLKYKLWLKKKEQKELEEQWKKLKMLLETKDKK